MKISHRTVLGIFASAAILVCSTLLWAGKPGTGNTGLPPVIPNHNFAAFEWRPDLGGWLDTSNNVVWGYSILQLRNHGVSYDQGLTGLNGNYASILEENGDAEAAAGNLENAALYYEAADAASLYSNWRTPTVTEARAAVTKGLFTYGPDGFNSWAASPVSGPGLAYDGVPTWTSDKGNKKGTAWVFDPIDGRTGLLGTGSSMDAIMVRTHTP